MLCPKCGTGLSVDDKYCTKCGLKQGAPTLMDGLKEIVMPISIILMIIIIVIAFDWLAS
ncbi:zinc ribbon domain-containing protein [Deltaproteobacteria bacterium OttesenSCG-928-K17]|nr:zinc ribbon domain-containing protein [Deltaproteobacteria bacterium OttesenSCG-928-K17]